MTAHVIVIGNEKGGSGKSTTAMHVIVALLQSGKSVGSIDVDSRQGTLSHYIANRKSYIEASGNDIRMPDHVTIDVGREQQGGALAADEAKRLEIMIEGARQNHDVVVIDTPGSASTLSRLAHSYADTLITPVNDSLVDLDVLAHVDPRKMTIKGPSHYAEMVWEQKRIRATRDRGTINWIVMRNRISPLDSYNGREMIRLLGDLSSRIKFKLVPGFSERVIFRELFLVGLTILDLKNAGQSAGISKSHTAARNEVWEVIQSIGLPQNLEQAGQ